jgi:hypothetical protein
MWRATVMAKLPPLADVTGVNGINYVFDPGKVSVVYVIPLIDPDFPKATPAGRPGVLFEQQYSLPDMTIARVGPPTTHVWGIVTSPLAIPDKPVDFLNKFKIADKFVLLTSLAGEIRIKATGISWLLSEYPGVIDPRVHCVLSLGGASTSLFQIIEDVPTVRARIDAIRLQSEGAEI